VALPSIPDVLTAVEDGAVDLGFVGIENSIEGAVTVTVDALAFETHLLIQREVVMDVQMPEHDGHSAAIAPGVAAKVYGLDVLATDIEDHPTTPPASSWRHHGRGIPALTGHDKTSIVLYQRHDRPGSRLAILQEFAARSINLTKLESRPTKKGLGQLQLPDRPGAHIGDELIADCLRDLRSKVADVRFLGSYPAAGEHGPAGAARPRPPGTRPGSGSRTCAGPSDKGRRDQPASPSLRPSRKPWRQLDQPAASRARAWPQLALGLVVSAPRRGHPQVRACQSYPIVRFVSGDPMTPTLASSPRTQSTIDTVARTERVLTVTATLAMGLIAGFFYAYDCSVMIGLHRTETPPSSPPCSPSTPPCATPFAPSFFGALVLSVAAAIVAVHRRSPARGPLIAAAVL
jgi:prephenate dehydratase